MHFIDDGLGAFEKILGRTKTRAQRLEFNEEEDEGADDGEQSDNSWYMIEISPGTLTNVLNELGK